MSGDYKLYALSEAELNKLADATGELAGLLVNKQGIVPESVRVAVFALEREIVMELDRRALNICAQQPPAPPPGMDDAISKKFGVYLNFIDTLDMGDDDHPESADDHQ
jgi:hypothetical protein